MQTATAEGPLNWILYIWIIEMGFYCINKRDNFIVSYKPLQTPCLYHSP